MNHPPRLALWLLRRITHAAHVDYVLGDLQETFDELNKRYGRREARRWYWGQALRSARPLLSHFFYWCLVMFRNYLKIALRNLRKQKGYAFINIFGLAIGLAFCTLIFLFVRDELTYDHFHTNKDQIFRIITERYHPDGSVRGSNMNMPFILGPTAHETIPEVQYFVRAETQQHFIRTTGDPIEDDVFYTDPDLFELFTFPVVQGNPDGLLTNLDGVVLTEAAATKYFGRENPIGQTLPIRLQQQYEDFTVTAVVADPPSNSTLKFGVILPFDVLFTALDRFRPYRDSWDISMVHTYVGLHPGTEEATVEAKLDDVYATYNGDYIQNLRDSGRWTGAGMPETYALESLESIHLTYSSDPLYSYILSGIALAILLIACINFMTLAIGRSASRAKEVGIRKVVGAQRQQLMGQFWGEALVLSFAALLIGIGLVYLFLPIFNDLADKNLAFAPMQEGLTLVTLLGLMLLAGLGAGGYPALVLSRFKPIETLKNSLRLGGSNGFTKSLVVVQFALSVFLIASTLIMRDQLDYLRIKNLGFNKEHLVVVETSGLDGRHVAQRFRNSLQNDPRILGMSATSGTLGYRGSRGIAYEHEGQRYHFDLFSVETDYLDVLDIELVMGHDFDPNLNDSSDVMIVNEAAVRSLGLVDPIGQTIPGLRIGSSENQPEIIGVMRDYNFQSLYQEVGPVILMRRSFWGYSHLMVRIAPENVASSIGLLEETWESIAPDVPFAYRFLDDQMQATYQNDQRWGQIIQYAALFAILVACLGLFGLAALSVANRTKEIGVRKVLGASTGGIALLLARQFALLVSIGILIAAPIAYIVMDEWLAQFAFRVDVGAMVFLGAGGLALVVALSAVAYQAIKAGLTNPVEALRYE